jgi:drug/metabolite transporter (DMT)-like permease
VGQESGEQHWRGVGLTAASAVAYSTAGFFTRLIHLDPWTILFWRGLFAGLFIACCILWRYRRATWAAVRAIGLPGLAAASLSTLATIFFINAFRRTSVADVTIIFATAPFVTAALGWLWIGERESWTTLVASTGALLGVIVMVSGAVILFLALFGITQFGLGLLLLTLGARLISATESALMNALEGPLAPFWVWLAFREAPSPATLIGGVIVMLAVSAHILTSGRTRTVPRHSAAMRGS